MTPRHALPAALATLAAGASLTGLLLDGLHLSPLSPGAGWPADGADTASGLPLLAAASAALLLGAALAAVRQHQFLLFGMGLGATALAPMVQVLYLGSPTLGASLHLAAMLGLWAAMALAAPRRAARRGSAPDAAVAFANPSWRP